MLHCWSYTLLSQASTSLLKMLQRLSYPKNSAAAETADSKCGRVFQ